jgi:hypothetical protein
VPISGSLEGITLVDRTQVVSEEEMRSRHVVAVFIDMLDNGVLAPFLVGSDSC